MSPKKTDANQAGMVEHLRQCGLMVILLHMVGKGIPDLMCVGYRRQTNKIEAVMVEVKTDKGKLTKEQEAWHQKWREKFPEGDAPLLIARQSEDVLAWFGLV